MTKEELIQYIRQYDDLFKDTPLEDYSYIQLTLIKVGIEEEKMKVSSSDLCTYNY